MTSQLDFGIVNKVPPRVWVEGDRLCYKTTANEALEDRHLTDRELTAFCRLAYAPENEAIADFARHNGVFGARRLETSEEQSAPWLVNALLTSDAGPKGMPPEMWVRAALQGTVRLADGSTWWIGAPTYFTVKSVEPEVRWEPISLWRTLARQFRAILRIRAAFNGRPHNPSPQLGQPEDWHALGIEVPNHVMRAQFQLSLEVYRIAGYGQIKVVPRLGTNVGWSIGLETDSGLIGPLSYRLLRKIVGPDKFFVCSGCGQPYARESRAPRPGQENFCSECTGLAGKRAVQRYRQKKRGER